MQPSESEISGPLQAKIMTILRNEALCGVDIMNRLNIKSPGTIYPVLEALRKKQFVEYEVETTGATRKKIYSLTRTGRKQITEHWVTSAKMFCCDATLHMDRILENLKRLVEIKPRQKILCTLDYEGIRRFLRVADVTFSYDLNVSPETYELALSFLGVGCLIGKEVADITDYVGRLYSSIKKGGSLLAIEIEKTDNMFARMFFEDIVGLKELPGLRKEELKNVLEGVGFKATQVTSRSGLLYSVSSKV